MLIIPAIDLKKNEVVRLTKGDFDNVSYYNTEAVDLVKKYIKDGALRIHIVLLLGARTGLLSDEEEEKIREILRTRDIYGRNCKIEIGGGIRRYSQVETLFNKGADLLILGTSLLIPLALESGLNMRDIKLCYQNGGKKFSEGEVPEFELLDKIDKKEKERILIAIDYEKDEVSLSGWEVTIPLRPAYMVRKFMERGFRRFIFTSIERDGTMQGIDLETVEKLLREVHSYDTKPEEVIISGGVSDETDLLVLHDTLHRPDGVIIGKALYQNKLTLKDSIKKFQNG